MTLNKIVSVAVSRLCIIKSGAKYRINFQGNIGKRKASAEIIEGVADNGDYYNKPISVILNYPSSTDVCKFTIDTDFNINSLKKENIKSIEYFNINDDNAKMINKEIVLKDGNEVKVKVKKEDTNKNAKLILVGYSPNVIYDKNKYYTESILDFNQFSDEYTIDAEK